MNKKNIVLFFGITLLLPMWILSFLSNKTGYLVDFMWYFLFSIEFILIFIVKSEDKTNNRIIGTFMFNMMCVALTIFLMKNYALDNSWKIVIPSMIAVDIPLFLIIPKLYAESNGNYTKEQKKIASKRIGLLMYFYWLVDVLFLCIIWKWNTFTYILGSITILIVFYNLTIAFLSNRKRKTFENICLLLDFVIAIAASVYLIYLIEDCSLQDIVTSIVSAIYGGLLTLVGVAWTIKHTNDINYQKKQEEVKPFFYQTIRYDKTLKVMKFILLDGKETDYIMLIHFLKNSSKIEFRIESIELDDSTYVPEFDSVIEKNQTYKIACFLNEKKRKYKNIILNARDVNNNSIKYEIVMDEKQEIVKEFKEVK